MQIFTLHFKKLLACFSLVSGILSCTKDASETQPDRLTSGNPPVLQAALPLPDSRKTLLVVDDKLNDRLHTEVFTIYTVTGLASTPFKYPIFTGETNMRIYDICRGNGVNNVYFICQAKDFPSVNDGIWNISMDGVKKTHIVNQFEFGGAPYELDFDRVGNKVYWGEGPNADRMTIWRHNADGSGKNQQVIINGVPEVGSFAVDGEGKRIFFKYKKDFKVVIGSCDLNGNIITPVVITMPELLDIFSPIDLDINTQKLYTATKGKTIILYANMNGVKQPGQVLYESIFNYVNWTYDFPKSNLYFTKLGNLNTIFSSGFQDQNEKVLLGGFEGITSIASVFTY